MTNGVSWNGVKYVSFCVKGTGRQVGEVDRRDGKYIIFYDGNARSLRNIGTRTNKCSAIKVLQEAIRAGSPVPVEFKRNVMSVREKLARIL